MALFYYQALERNGRKTKGMIEADSARHARQLLRGKELIPVHIEARMNTSSGGMLQRRRHAHRRVAAADLALFTRQLATLVQAAMPLETCLQAVSEQSEKLHVKSLGMALRSRIQEGYTLSDSLREHPRVFDSLFCSMVAAGEKSGHLDVVLNRLADYTEQRQRLKSRLLQAMLYPLVLLVVATGVVTILLTAVVPKIIEQFDHLGHALPASTRALIAMSDALQASGVYWLAGLLALLVLGQRLLKNPTMRLRWDKTVLRLPVTGRVARGLNTARFSRTLSILTASSVPLLEGIQTAAAVSANRYVEQQLLLAADRVREGSSLREHPRVFDSLFCSMVAAGEKSGHLDVVLNRLADYTEQRQRLKSRLLQAMLYPLVLLVVATGVVTILLTAVVPKIIEQFDHLGHALPVSTRTLIAMSDALQASGVYWLAGLLGLLVLGQRLLKNPAMRLRWDKTLLRLPVIGRVARGLNTARFSRTLSILTASSVPLLEGIQTAAAVSANRYVEQQLLLAADRVREGSSLRAALAELRLFPPMMLYMIASGEQSGELETMLEQAAVNQEREFDTQVGLALGLFEPALVVMMAGVVLFIVIAILEPMLQLNNMVGM